MNCGGCVFVLAYNYEDDVGMCVRIQSGQHKSVLFSEKSCKYWMDSRLRYPSQIKHIDDKNTLKWLHKVINDAYVNRVYILQEEGLET